MRIISTKMVTTRKEHQCWGCTRLFKKGSRLRRVTCVDSVIMSNYWCDECSDYIREGRYDDNNDGFTFGELVESDIEYYESIKNSDNPDCVRWTKEEIEEAKKLSKELKVTKFFNILP